MESGSSKLVFNQQPNSLIIEEQDLDSNSFTNNNKNYKYRGASKDQISKPTANYDQFVIYKQHSHGSQIRNNEVENPRTNYSTFLKKTKHSSTSAGLPEHFVLQKHQTTKTQAISKRPNVNKQNLSKTNGNEIIINKNSKSGLKHRFRPLEKLMEKNLADEDDIDSIDLSISYGPTQFVENQCTFANESFDVDQSNEMEEHHILPQNDNYDFENNKNVPVNQIDIEYESFGRHNHISSFGGILTPK